MAGNSLYDPESISSSEACIGGKVVPAGCIRPHFFSEVDFSLINPAFARITCSGNGIHATFTDWTGYNEIVVILSMTPTLFPAIHLVCAIMYKILHSLQD